MDGLSLVGKVLADCNSRKIGLIVDARRTYTENKDNGEEYKTIIIKFERSMKKELLIEIAAERVIKTEGIFAWLDITKDELKDLIKKNPKVEEKQKVHKKVDLTILKNFKPPPSF